MLVFKNRKIIAFLAIIILLLILTPNWLIKSLFNLFSTHQCQNSLIITGNINSENNYSHTLPYYANIIHLSKQNFDFKSDIFALMHIQKTGGSAWESHIHKNLHVKFSSSNQWEPMCTFKYVERRYTCAFNKYSKSMFWDPYVSRLCDIHADYTELKNCIMFDYKNRILAPKYGFNQIGIAHFITFLRDPVQRYISEYEHVKRGATWQDAVRTCKDQDLFKKTCYKKESWKHATWKEFLSCEYNLANNRQVRMLANHNIIGCDVLKCWTQSSNCNSQLRKFNEQKLLESAKHTLIGLAFFGLTEYQELSEYLFVKTFGDDKFKFIESIKTLNETEAIKSLDKEASKHISLIKLNNRLDIELYEFAKDLFFKRIQYFKNHETST